MKSLERAWSVIVIAAWVAGMSALAIGIYACERAGWQTPLDALDRWVNGGRR